MAERNYAGNAWADPEYLRAVRKAADQEAVLATYAAPEIPFLVLLDGSRSMTLRFDGCRSRWSALTDCQISLLTRMRASEELAQSVRVTVIIFNTEDEVICENVLLADLNIPDLEQTLRQYRPHGITALGKAIVNAVGRIEARKDELRKAKRDYYQGILVASTDGVATNEKGRYSVQSMSQAVHLCRELIEKDKLTVLPVGIASAGASAEDFSVLNSLIGKSAEDGEGSPVFTNTQDLENYFRFIGHTLQALEEGEDVRDSVRRYLGYKPGTLQ